MPALQALLQFLYNETARYIATNTGYTPALSGFPNNCLVLRVEGIEEALEEDNSLLSTH